MPETKSAKNRRSGERRVTPRPTPGSAVWYVLGFLVLMALPGTPGPNRFGPDPKGQGEAETFA